MNFSPSVRKDEGFPPSTYDIIDTVIVTRNRCCLILAVSFFFFLPFSLCEKVFCIQRNFPPNKMAVTEK